ncbi:MAG: hypothetical protein IJ266_04415, partial [Elusimicrobiaceae bacterium]|nr:hypothetical protein [Elusimicrobiaceae bacterium]
IDLASMHDGTKLFSALRMVVGASSASTGGGVKTTTVAVLLLSIWSVIRGGEETVVLGRRLPAALTRRALAIVMVATLLL